LGCVGLGDNKDFKSWVGFEKNDPRRTLRHFTVNRMHKEPVLFQINFALLQRKYTANEKQKINMENAKV
jgi:hypothetical protein